MLFVIAFATIAIPVHLAGGVSIIGAVCYAAAAFRGYTVAAAAELADLGL